MFFTIVEVQFSSMHSPPESWVLGGVILVAQHHHELTFH